MYYMAPATAYPLALALVLIHMYALSQVFPAGLNPEALDVKVATDIRHHARHISQVRRQSQPGPEEQGSLRVQRGGASKPL